MLDAATAPALHPDQQDAATAYDRCQVPSGSRPVWCVAATLPRSERIAHAELHRRGFEAYLPLITTRWRDRTWHTSPLFPGYLFVQLDLARPWNPVRYAPGVFCLLATNGIPSICPDGALEALRAGDALRASPRRETTQWAPGVPCRPATGPFRDHPAVVASVQRETATITLMLFGHLRTVSVPLDALAPRGDP
jgi:transcription antitermination factor NusG